MSEYYEGHKCEATLLRGVWTSRLDGEHLGWFSTAKEALDYAKATQDYRTYWETRRHYV